MKEKYIKDIYRFLEKSAKGKKVLDCGAAGESVKEDSPYWIHKALADHASFILGFDTNREAIERLKKKGYNMVYGDCESLKLKTRETFDMVFSGELIEHLGNPGRFLEGVKRYLKKDEGRLILTTPNAFSLYRGAAHLFGITEENPGHVLVQNEKTLRQLLQTCGYETVRIHYFTNPTFYQIERMKMARRAVKPPAEFLFRLKPSLAHQILVIAKY